MSFTAYNPIPSLRKRDLEPSNILVGTHVDNLASDRFRSNPPAKPISKHETRAFSVATRKSSLIAREALLLRLVHRATSPLPPSSPMVYPSHTVGRSRIRQDCVFATSKCVYPRYRLTHARTCSTRRSTTRCPLASHRPRGSVSTIPPLLGSGAACFIAVTWYGCDVTRSLTILCPRH